ncbi:MAG: helix-turn-helix transcriptional regulator [Candidatus Eisenbacteria bacterium]|nr:helix-turn-helix transcriptional regulator [Candidatus Eisenbacteria bacterium]MCC7142147.1 helix-turn-helix transcriptional regulator [Candidatus Eisenbacteria bacterium]
MGTKERRERERQEVRALILDAARELFATAGYEAVTMRMVAEKIEYSPTSIYLHFRDKQQLVQEICEHDFCSLAAAFQRIALVADPVERVRQIGLAYVDFARAYPHHYRLMFMMPTPPKAPGEVCHERGNPEQDAYAFLRLTIEQVQAAGRLRPELEDIDLVTQMCWAAVHGVISLHLAKGADPWVEWRSISVTAEALIDSLNRGMFLPPVTTGAH